MTAISDLAKLTPRDLFNNVGDWVLQYVLKPIGQILLFVVIAGSSISLLALVVGFVLQTDWHGIDILRVPARINLFEQVVRQLPNMFLDGITIGFVYAVIALGYTMVYGVLKFINFAHSEIFMMGAVIGYEVMVRLRDGQLLTTLPPLLVIVLMIAAAMVICGGVAVIVERVAYKPLRGAPRLVPLISAIGVSFFLTDFVRGFQALNRNIFNMPYLTDQIPFLTQRIVLAEGLSTTNTTFIIILSAVIMLVGLNYFVNATKIGKGIRAVSQDQATASLMGINVNLMITITFMVGGALGGAAGVLYGLKTTNVTPYIGFIPGLKAFTAAVLGGIGNITGAMLGGLLLGMLEAFFSALLPYFPALGLGYSDIFAFAVLILVLLFRPTGLLGKKVDEKV
ncbi:MAG: branched-chain amino acid ABC transporter permease [Candidatus Thermofonsia Clade 1 bacterium]|uniref:Branched-chain amino acid ABC transporter permease n=1 Tax=Candidatus Thermofonsia Clade 1 bacterium TaxID=2364210 RepID=A0A2M8Q0Z5_9CHLR|nr:MAG: branched-chain amino acid ABC transporter permease [Candidatus Thermofonsia Clade 1 bacterium]PJF43468.1 MAG: branched-chain amino acid ABC transporter permease [Candidatus Thermofonsia Clade 1 bacterium]RMF52239.1 MAG: branched-chain amino acid ABC transporter permease [Chloroflexota bacterium]